MLEAVKSILAYLQDYFGSGGSAAGAVAFQASGQAHVWQQWTCSAP
jgi:hypothetical protein